MNRLRGVVLALLIPWATGCAIVGAEPLPVAAGRPPVCLERHAGDDRNIAALVATALRDHDFDVSLVGEGGCRDSTLLRATYVDSFGWDMRVFLLRLTVEIVDDRSGESLAIGESCQPSLAALGDSYAEVAERAVRALLGEEDS